jgi:DNA-binding CsgD family transcriptional regulator
MQRLSTADYSILLDSIRELHAFRDLASLRLWLLDVALPRLISADWLSYNEVDLKAPQNTVILIRPNPASFLPLLPRFAELSHQHPIIARQVNRRDLSVRTISEFIARADFQRLDLYNDIYRHLGVEYQISAALETRRDFITALALSRRRRDFGERDRALLGHLQRHLIVAMKNLWAADAVAAASQDCVATLESHLMAAITVNQRGAIVRHHGAALEWIRPRGARLPADIFAWVKARLATVADMSSQKDELHIAAAEGDIAVRALPSAIVGHTLLTLTLRPGPGKAKSPTLALSPRESEVARWICAGKTNAQIAQILGISPRTVQKHVEHIFDRVGVDSRIALATQMLRSHE